MNVDLWNRIYGHKSRGLGGAVDDGDARHPVHSRMVKACGDWLNGQRGVLVWATGTGRWTAGATKGTPGVPDLVGWHLVSVEGLVPIPHIAEFLAVECKVLPDKLNPAQQAFRKVAEAANVLYFLAEWDGEGDDPAAGLREQWGEQ